MVTALLRGRGPRVHRSGPLAALTPSELEVATLVSQGLNNPEIAARLFMSRGTVKAHLAHVYPKLGVPNRAALAALVHRTRN
nr:helix-turn-helix transcriptional regulator [Actinopolymorpha cephalotaxi]